MAERIYLFQTNGTLISSDRIIVDAVKNLTYFITNEENCMVLPGASGIGTQCFGTAYGYTMVGKVHKREREDMLGVIIIMYCIFSCMV